MPLTSSRNSIGFDIQTSGVSPYDATTSAGSVTTIRSPNISALDEYGWSVGIGSNRIVVGARYTQVGDKTQAGTAFILDMDGNEIRELDARISDLVTDAETNAYFGWSVAAGSNRIIVGAPYEDNTEGTNAGAAYVYTTGGNFLTKIFPTELTNGSGFGWSVAAGCGRLVVGALSGAGMAFIYDADGYRSALLQPISSDETAAFGRSVAVGSGRVVVGAPTARIDGFYVGAVYVYDLNGNLIIRIPCPPEDRVSGTERFGWSVAVGSGRIVVGNPYQSIGGAAYAGKAYIYDLNGNLITTLIRNGSQNTYDSFGNSVAVGSGRIAIDAPGPGSSTASVSLYDLNGNFIQLINRFDPLDTIPSMDANSTVAIGNGKLVFGSPSDDVSGSNAGAIHLASVPNQIHLLDILDDR